MKNITLTKIGIWTILAILIRLYCVDLPNIVNISRSLHEKHVKIDSVMCERIIEITEKHNATVDYLKHLKEEQQ